jgi:hypothetical protein
MLTNNLFNIPNNVTYPPFKNGVYLEEFFKQYYKSNNITKKRRYIPVTWTNFQINSVFNYENTNMQRILNDWVNDNPCEFGYFTVVQYDDGPLLNLPNNTIVYGACSGNIPIPLIYEDINNTLENYPKKSFNEKLLLCSFVGNITANHIFPNVRKEMFNILENKNQSKFKLINSGGWTTDINQISQNTFIETTINSKFALAPRGYGRGSFRFFECFQLGTIPIYLWNDIEWLPFKETIDYSKLCISLHISRINELEQILENITEEKYNQMFDYYNEMKHLFTLEGMVKQILTTLE